MASSTGAREAQQAFVDILRRAPTHFSALNQFGTLLAEIGAIDAACRVYSEAILHHPANPMARVNLANLLLRANRHNEAREQYETALRLDPDYAPAHQGLGAVLADIGDRAGAQAHFHRGFRDHAVSTLPYRGSGRRCACCNWSPRAAATSRRRAFSTTASISPPSWSPIISIRARLCRRIS